jgi:prefoldin subunit 5
MARTHLPFPISLQIPYHDLCHDLQANKDELEDHIEDLKIKLKNKDHSIAELQAALKVVRQKHLTLSLHSLPTCIVTIHL